MSIESGEVPMMGTPAAPSGRDAELAALGTQLAFGTARQCRQAAIGEALALELAQACGAERRLALALDARLLADQIGKVGEKPDIDSRQFVDTRHRPARAQR